MPMRLAQLALALLLVSTSWGCSSDQAAGGGPGPGSRDAAIAADSGPGSGAGDAAVDIGVGSEDAIAGADDAATGAVDGATGSDDGAAGTDDGAMGSDDGAVGSDDGAVNGDADTSDGPFVLDSGPPAADATAAADAAAGSDAAVSDGGGRDAANICASSADCIPGTEVCGAIRVVSGLIETHCTHTNPSPPASAIGGACTMDSQCHENLCLDAPFSDECTVICADAMIDCPAGFTCTGYQYNPGPVWVYMCTRSCSDNSGCGAGVGGNPGNICSPQTYQRGGSWFLDNVCQIPQGPNGLGTACTNGNDCQSGLCLTTTRSTNCTSAAGCMADETCACPGGGMPPCAGGAQGACISSLCSAVCNDNSDCAAAGQPLTECRSDIDLTLPDGTTVPLQSCGRS